MKNLITLLIILLVAGLAQADMTAWVMGENNTITARVGMTLDPNNIEIGAQTTWYPDDDTPQIYGVYGIFVFDQSVSFRQPIPVEWLPETLEAKPYIGGLVTVDVRQDDRRTLYGPVAGVIIKEIMVIEYAYHYVDDQLQDYMKDESRVSFGLRFKF